MAMIFVPSECDLRGLCIRPSKEVEPEQRFSPFARVRVPGGGPFRRSSLNVLARGSFKFCCLRREISMRNWQEIIYQSGDRRSHCQKYSSSSIIIPKE